MTDDQTPAQPTVDQLPAGERDAITAAARVAAAWGGRRFRFGHRVAGGWWAEVGAGDDASEAPVVHIADMGTLIEAADGLAASLLNARKCAGCGRIITTNTDGVHVDLDAQLEDGTRWTEEQIQRDGMCLWARHGDWWTVGCEPIPPHLLATFADPLEGVDRADMDTGQYLAHALAEAGAPGSIVTAALLYRYDDFRGDSAANIHELLHDLRAAAKAADAAGDRDRGRRLAELGVRAIDGDFDSTAAESRAWFESEQGQRDVAVVRRSPHLTAVLDQLQAAVLDPVAVARAEATVNRAREAWSTPRPGQRPEGSRRRRR